MLNANLKKDFKCYSESSNSAFKIISQGSRSPAQKQHLKCFFKFQITSTDTGQAISEMFESGDAEMADEISPISCQFETSPIFGQSIKEESGVEAEDGPDLKRPNSAFVQGAVGPRVSNCWSCRSV